MVDGLTRVILPKTAGPIVTIAALTGVTAILSGFMNNVGALALLMPVALQIAKRLNDQLLQVHGDDLAGIFAVCEPNANGTLEALRNAGMNKKVTLIAFDSSDALIEALGDGSCSGIVLQNPVQMGYKGVMTMIDAINGKSAAAFQSTGEAVATPENMNEPEIQKLLKPEILE